MPHLASESVLLPALGSHFTVRRQCARRAMRDNSSLPLTIEPAVDFQNEASILCQLHRDCCWFLPTQGRSTAPPSQICSQEGRVSRSDKRRQHRLSHHC